ncbi:GNAT family N-acetyltransferase [bacterium]|nr:GNAT family N-acetyltransferase [bacterium]
MKIIDVHCENDFPKDMDIKAFCSFMNNHLGEYGDPVDEIRAAVDYAFSKAEGKGGFVLLAYINDDPVGGLVINATGMTRYIPENYLVYIAAHEKWQAVGVGRYLLDRAIELAEGDIALHVEQDNPAVRFYEKMGFESKYLEMRLKRS